MRKIKYIISCHSLLLTLCPWCEAAQQKIECPHSIAATSIRVVDTEAGWTPFIGAAIYLNSAAPIYGPPQDRSDIADFTTRTGKAGLSYTYALDSTSERGKWMRCAYGPNHEMTLSRRIDDATQKCTISYRKGKKAAQNDIEIICQ